MTSDFNKHRFRNFCIGMIITCLSLWYVFEYKFVLSEHNSDISLEVTEIPKGIEIFSFQPPPPPKRIEKTSPVTKPPLPVVTAQIKIVTHEVAAPSNIPKPKMVAFTGPMPVLISTTSEDIIEERVDLAPSFPGGAKALRHFLARNLRYPDDCYNSDLEGTVHVRFVVDLEGKITQIEVLDNELLPSAAIESKRVISLMPKWKPGIKNGRPVKTYFIQPIVFTTF